jgi:TonB-dependent receptor
MKGKLIRLTFTLILFFVCTITFAQQAEIYGYVKDAMSNDLLPGATVAVDETSMGTITNGEGYFRLANINPGKYTLVFSYIGFLSERVEVDIKAGEKKEVKMVLTYDAFDINEVVVSAQILGQAKALNQQLNSDALVNVVSSDKIKELPDVNAAEAIGRLPGISVSRVGGEASKVTVRGLSPKLTSITINGVKVAATSIGQSTTNPTSSSNSFSDDRSVDLSMISPELLSSIEVYKSPTADMDGDAIGGIVNLGIMKAPDKATAKVQSNGGFNGLSNSFSNYKFSADGSKRFHNNKFGVLGGISYEKVNRNSQTVRNSYSDTYMDEAGKDSWEIDRTTLYDYVRDYRRFGLNGTFDYQYNSGFIVGQGFYSGRDANQLSNQDYVDVGGEVRHLPGHSKTKTSTYQGVLSGQQRINALSVDWTVAKSQTIGDNYYDVVMYLKEDQGFLNTTGEKLYTPQQLLSFRTNDFSNGYLQQYSFEPDKTQQDNITAALDFKLDYTLSNKLAGFLKFGAKHRTENRSRSHNHQYVGDYYLTQSTRDKANANMGGDLIFNGINNSRISMENFYENKDDKLKIWDGEYSLMPKMDMDYVDLWHEKQQGELYKNLERSHDRYDLTERVSAMYVMTKITFNNWITFIPGLRYEYSDNNYFGYYSSYVQATNGTISSGNVRDTTTYQTYGVILPSFHLKLKPLDWFDVRLSAVKTLARPDYAMLVPRVNVATDVSQIYKGNPDLKNSEAWSYDATVSFFSNKLGLLSVGGFYKKFDNYFTEVEYDISSDRAASLNYPRTAFHVEEDYQNFDDSKVYGFELDLQTNFTFLPSPFNGIVFNANLTRLWSETYNPKYNEKETYYIGRDAYFIYDTVGYSEKSVLPDQVELAGNISLGYDYKGFACRISMIYQSPSLKNLGNELNKENLEFFKNYTDRFLRFDASISQKIGKHVKLAANIANLTNESERSYQYKSKYWTGENRYGTTVDLSIQYKF